MDFLKRFFDIFAFLGSCIFVSACFINNPVIAGIGYICSIILVAPSLIILFRGIFTFKYQEIESSLFAESIWYWDGLFLIVATLLYNVGYPIIALVILASTILHLIISLIHGNKRKH